MNDTGQPSLDEPLIADKVRSEMSRVYVERLSDSALIAPLGVVLAAWLIYSAAGWTPALVWACAMAFIELLILFVGYRYQRCLAQQTDTTPWLRAQLAVSGLVGLGWGSAVWFVWVDGEMLLYIAMLCVLVGVSGICMVTMAPQRMATLLFSLGMLAPPLLQLAWVDNPLGLKMALGWVVMIAVQAWTARDLRRELSQELDSALRNRSLLQMLSKASTELQLAGVQKEEKNAQLAAALDQLEELVSRDQLTGAYSRRYIFEQLDRLAAVSQRHGAPVTAVMFDLDHFKAINDTYGHPTGDRALQEVVRAASAQLRDGDILARVGGEEFLVLLPMTGLSAAIQLTERLRHTLALTAVDAQGGATIFLPASFGVAELAPGESYTEWFKRADSALYQAKEKGRNMLVAA
jgi:diguanylate cyclase (GGDEF)-like protein